MSRDTKRPLETVLPIAEKIQQRLQPYCERIEIAGSLRRRKPYIGDIELVAIPRHQHLRNLLGEVVERENLLISYLEKLRQQNQIHVVKGGARYYQFTLTTELGYNYTVDVFMAIHHNFGNIHLIRTGSADFSAYIMHHIKSVGMSHSGGYLLDDDGVRVDCPTERDLFEAIAHPYVEPQHRSTRAAWEAAVRDAAW